MANYGSLYRWGTMRVVVETGQPQDAVRIGLGDSVEGAIASLESTACQSVGRDSGEAAALEWAIGAGWLDGADSSDLEDMGRVEWDEDGEIVV